MRLTTILFWQVLLILLAALIGVSIAAQWTAAALDYSPRLGSPWFTLFEVRIYPPWRFFAWWYAYNAYAPEVFNRAGLIAAGGGFAGLVVAIAGAVLRARESRRVTTYGSSRWAEPADVRRAGLLDETGVFLGQYKGRYLRHDGPEHVMAFAPTRSGKGVGLVVPTLLSWPHSAVIHDIKGENWDITAGWRSGFSRAVRFDPTDPETPRYNPLLEVRRGHHEVRDVQNIADILVDPEGILERRSHWDKTAHSLLVGAILHVLYAEEDKTLASVAALLSDPAQPITDTLERMLATNHVGSEEQPRVHATVAQSAREVLNKAPNERSGVISTALSFLSLYRDPTLARATSACDWRIGDLVAGNRPLSLYLVVPPSDLSRTKPLVRLILNQIGRRLTEDFDGRERKRRDVLFMLDEFPALGRLDFFESALAFMAGYGLRAFLIAQSLNQIEKAYGPTNAILDNCHVRVAFATNDERTARRISDALGEATELRAMKNYTGHRLAPMLTHTMVSRQEVARQLLTPGEVMQLPASDELVMVSGSPPLRARKLRYFEDRNFTARVLPVPDPSAEVSADTPPGEWTGQRAWMHAELMANSHNQDGPKKQRSRRQGFEQEQEVETGPAAAGEGREPARENTLFDSTVRDADAMDHVSEKRLFGGGRER